MNPFVSRAVRVPTPPIEARLGAELGRLLNVSATGALVHTFAPITSGRQCALVLNLSDPAMLLVRVVRSEAIPVQLPGALSRLRQYQIGVAFTDVSGRGKQALDALCGPQLGERE